MIAAGHADDNSLDQDPARRLIVRLVFIIFLLLVFEGALRKWVLPGLQRPLYFVCDPFVLLVYACVLLNGLILRSRMLSVLGLFAVAVAVFYLLLAVLGIGHLVSWAIGVRHYFFYMPLAFIIGYCFRFDDLAALIRLSLLLAIPIAVLVYLQHQSPPSAFVNRALDDELDNVTYVAGDILRPYGTFTYTSGHVAYVAVSLTLLAIAWLMRREMRLPLWLILPASGAVFVMALTTGSRTIWFFGAHLALCLIAVVVSGGQSRNSLRALAFVMLAVLGVIVLYATLLTPAYEAMLVRHESATQTEGAILLRALRSVTHAFTIIDQAPISGFGLGAGILGAVAATTGRRAFVLAETEWDRIVLELGPVFGLGFIALRIVLVGWLLWRALVANRTYGNPIGLLLFGFVGVHVVAGQITMSGQGAMFAWLLVGLLLAATNAPSHMVGVVPAPRAAPVATGG